MKLSHFTLRFPWVRNRWYLL